LNKINESTREMLGKMSDIVWAINPANDNFDKVIARLKNFAANTAGSLGISLHFKTGEDIQKAYLDMQQRKNIYMVCKEAINNAARYAECQNLFIDFQRQDREINISILDDGMGFDLQQSFEGNGLNNMRARAKEIKAKLEISSEKSKGTTVRLSFKITQLS
jgi:signal transduction histidine kinase